MIEQTLLRNLLHNEEFIRKTIPYIKQEYFDKLTDSIVFDIIKKYFDKFNRPPTQEILAIELGNRDNIDEKLFLDVKHSIEGLTDSPQNLDWLVEKAEEFCKEKAIYNGLLSSLTIMKDAKRANGEIVKILEDALGVSFNSHLGHDYVDDAEARYDYYHRLVEKIPFDIDILNKITKGGLPKKTLTVLIGGVSFGKTATMTHFAAANMCLGKNVLYITMEMAEEEIARRVDANLLDISLDDLELLPREAFVRKVQSIREKTPGRLKIKEYPTGNASVADFRACLQEYRIKHKFEPDIIYIDYLNICKSSRVKFSQNVGLYEYNKFISEELRGLGIEKNVPVVTAIQFNREGFTNSDPGMEHSAESFGIPATADFMLAIITNEELELLNQVMFKQIKNRFGSKRKDAKFIIGRDLDKMRLYDFEGRKLAEVPVVNPTKERFERKKAFQDFC